MKHTKTNFRAIREICGLSQADMADLAGVSISTIKRWERPEGQEPPDDVWETLEDWHRRHGEMVKASVGIVADLTETHGRPKVITLPYWRTQAEYDLYGRDDGIYSVINAASRAVAERLLDEGLAVEFIPFDERGEEVRE